MSIITVFNALYSNEEKVIQLLLEKTGYTLLADKDVISAAGKLSGISAEKIARVFSNKTSLFNQFTREKERSIAYLRLAVANALPAGNLMITGFSSQLVPTTISHVLRICLVAEMNTRLQQATVQAPIEKEPLKIIHKNDEEKAAWVLQLTQSTDPWNPKLYDIVIPTDKISAEQSVHLVINNLQSDILNPTDESLAALSDFQLQAKVQVTLAEEGHDVSVTAKNGSLTLTIEKNVLMLGRLEQELQEIVSKIDGVKTVAIQVGKNFHQADIYRKIDFQAPSKVLLVDDEREFVQTLSERLLLRDLGSAIAYDGESALEMLSEDEPEVMILDLKMPGIDGIEVLRRVKTNQPDIEVIILTGHGNETDKETCMKLGAFAYLNKPVDIDVLSETMKKANEKIQQKKLAAQGQAR